MEIIAIDGKKIKLDDIGDNNEEYIIGPDKYRINVEGFYFIRGVRIFLKEGDEIRLVREDLS